MFFERDVLENLARTRELEKFLVQELFLERNQAILLARRLSCHREELIEILTEELEWEVSN